MSTITIETIKTISPREWINLVQKHDLRKKMWFVTAAMLDRSGGKPNGTGFNRNDYQYATRRFGIVDILTDYDLKHWLNVLYKYRKQIEQFSKQPIMDLLFENEMKKIGGYL